MKRSVEKFIESKKIFRCPVCGGKLSVTENGSFLCKKKHCFDLSAKGYVNLLSGQALHKNKYDRELFECRNQVFGAGFYDPVLEEIRRCIAEHFGPAEGQGREKAGEDQPADAGPQKAGTQKAGQDPIRILDAGCGEGFYSLWLDDHMEQAEIFGLDIVKEAIRIACRRPSDVRWMVGNLADIPLYNSSFDVVLNVLTPANYREFCRILKQDGLLIKVVPGSGYLREVRQCVSEQLLNKEYRNDSTVDYFQDNMELIQRREVRYTLPVTEEQAGLFLRMTPMTFHVDTDGLPAEKVAGIREITIHLELLVGRRPSGTEKPKTPQGPAHTESRRRR